MAVGRDVGHHHGQVQNWGCVFTILAAVFGPVFLLVTLLLPAKPHGRDSRR
jgi:hypothetical protein